MLLAQVGDFGGFIEKVPSGDLIALFAIATVFTTLFLIVLVVCITRTISNVRVASINAKMVKTLAEHGHSADEIERIVKSSVRGLQINLPSRWKPATPLATNGKGIPPRATTTS